MKISFYKEQRVYGNPAREVKKAIEILKDLPILTLDFNDNISTINIKHHGIKDEELEIMAMISSHEELFNEITYENEEWYESHYNLLNAQNDTDDILIYFHETNPWKWYSHIGIGNNNGQRLITIATSNEIWHNIPNKPAALAHEIISSILLSQAINSIDEYHKLPGNISFKPGSLADGLWLEKTKKYDNVLSNIITNNMYEAGTKMMQLKIKSADIEDELLDYLNNRNVNEFLIRDIVSGLKALAHSNSNVVKKGLDKLKPSRLVIDFRNRKLKFIDINKEHRLAPQLFTLYCCYLIAKKISYPQLKNEIETVKRIYGKFQQDNDISALFRGKNSASQDFRSAKSKLKETFTKEIFKNVPEYAEYYTISPAGKVHDDLEYYFQKDVKDTLHEIIPDHPENRKIKFSKINFI